MKKIIISLIISCLLFGSTNFTNAFNLWYSNNNYNTHYATTYDTLSWQQAKNYVEQIIASFDHALRPHIKSTTLTKLKNSILDTIRANTDLYYYRPNTSYKKELIDQYINSAILTYIEQSSYDYAFKKIKQARVAQRIAESMRNNAMARLMNHGVVDPEALVQFVGSSLEKAVSQALNQFDMPYIQEPKQLYPSQECCVCYDSFDTKERIFLYPCGHDICKQCAYAWFFSSNNNHVKCPLCRTVVDQGQLNYALAH